MFPYIYIATADEYNIVDVQKDSASTLSFSSINNDLNSNATSPLREIQPDHDAFATNTFEVTTMSSRRESMQVEPPKLGESEEYNMQQNAVLIATWMMLIRFRRFGQY